MLTEENAAKSTKDTYRRICKPCRSKASMLYQRENAVDRRLYINSYVRKTGKVKQYPCLTCLTLCYKVYAKAFCSTKCRFMSYVEKTETCWIWNGARNGRGYGKVCFESNPNATAHRSSYQLFKGPIADGLSVCHSCDNPSCVNPDHLWLGTIQDNKKDQIDKNRGGVKLKANQVLEIRKMYEYGIGSLTIAKLFKVTCGTISSIAKRRIWKHI